MASILDQILAGENPELATVGISNDSLIKTGLSLAVTGMCLVLFGFLTQKQPLIASGIAVITIVAALIYFNRKA